MIASNGVPFLQMRLVGLHSTLIREKEGKKERTGKVIQRLGNSRSISDVKCVVGPIQRSDEDFQ